MGPALGCALCGAACAACSSSSPPRRALVTTILSAQSDSPAPRNLDANQLHNSHFGGERFPRQPSAAHSYVSRRLQSRCRRWCAPAERAQPCTAPKLSPGAHTLPTGHERHRELVLSSIPSVGDTRTGPALWPHPRSCLLRPHTARSPC